MAQKIGKINVREADQISFVLDNIPGSLAKVAEALRDANVNVEGMSHSDTTDTMVMDHMVVDKIDVARKVLSPMVKSISAQKILSFRMDEDRPGFIALVARKFGDAYINIETIYHASAGRGDAAIIYIRVSNKNHDKALKLAEEIADSS